MPNARWLFACGLIATLLSPTAGARAEDTRADAHQIGRAEALFSAGKQRMAYSDYAAACSLFAQSYLLDPATGSLLALALCHERQGKLASALAEYERAAERSRTERRADREHAALLQLARLRPRVSTLTLRPDEPGLRLAVRVNGEPIPPEQLGEPLPMDGGFLLIEAEAEGKISWRTGLTIAASGETLTVSIPLLRSGAGGTQSSVEPDPAPPVREAAPVPKVELSRSPEPIRRGPKLNRLERTGIALLCSGALSAGAAVGFTLRAVSKNKQSEQGCVNDVCSDDARRDRLQARGSGNIATVAMVGAATLGTSGLISFLIGARRRRDTRAETTTSLRASAWLAASSGGGAVSGRF